MRVLVACEFSGVVREAFRRRGHEAWSCDLLPALDGSQFHSQNDARHVALDWKWDRILVFPPCTYLAVSGARWFKDRLVQQSDAAAFFMFWTRFKCVAIENPIGIMSRRYRKPDQIIQPWWFGHGETKATCLWLNGLPLLQPTQIVDGRKPRVHHESPGIKDGLTRQQRRAITLPGVAEAFAEQWGKS